MLRRSFYFNICSVNFTSSLNSECLNKDEIFLDWWKLSFVGDWTSKNLDCCLSGFSLCYSKINIHSQRKADCCKITWVLMLRRCTEVIAKTKLRSLSLWNLNSLLFLKRYAESNLAVVTCSDWVVIQDKMQENCSIWLKTIKWVKLFLHGPICCRSSLNRASHTRICLSCYLLPVAADFQAELYLKSLPSLVKFKNKCPLQGFLLFDCHIAEAREKWNRNAEFTVVVA